MFSTSSDIVASGTGEEGNPIQLELADGLLPLIWATSTTHPPNPEPGQLVFEADTFNTVQWLGGGTYWRVITPRIDVDGRIFKGSPASPTSHIYEKEYSDVVSTNSGGGWSSDLPKGAFLTGIANVNATSGDLVDGTHPVILTLNQGDSSLARINGYAHRFDGTPIVGLVRLNLHVAGWD